jgi:hypothetical protein
MAVLCCEPMRCGVLHRRRNTLFYASVLSRPKIAKIDTTPQLSC